MTLEEYREKFSEDDAVGWEAIDTRLKEIYADQKPRHYPAALPFMAGGEDPLQGISIYDSNEQEFHRHIVSYSMSELYYNEEAAENEFSKWGFEFTFRLKPFSEDKEDDPMWVISLMNNLARYVYDSGKWFEEYHAIPANGPIRLNTETDIVGLIFVEDPILGKMQTPNGKVTFLQMVGITSDELEVLRNNFSISEVNKLADRLRKNNPLLITDLQRK